MVARLKTLDKVVGVKQVKRALTSHEVKILYLANDVDDEIHLELLSLAKNYQVPVVELDTMEELGEACGIDVSAATAALLKYKTNK